MERDISLRLSRSAEDTKVRHERNHRLLFENLMEQMTYLDIIDNITFEVGIQSSQISIELSDSILI